ncbi:MAG: DUF7007 domain-containing protein [Methylocella sp.]
MPSRLQTLNDKRPIMNTPTPWGAAQHIEHVADGIDIVSTASHGGIMLDPNRVAAMPAYMSNASHAGPSAYEEDHDWCMPVLIFENEVRTYYTKTKHPDIAAVFTSAKASLRNWRPAVYEQFYGVALKPEESYTGAKKQFYEENKNNWIAVAAWGDWHKDVPAGMVAAAARLGCDAEKRSSKERRFFLIPASEYSPRPSDTTPRFAFVINLEKHKEIRPIA